MAKEIVVGAILENLDTWVQNIDRKQVELKTRKAELSLSDLQLRSDTIEAKLESVLGRKVLLSNGRIGRLQAHWSWTSLFSAPVKFEASDVLLQFVMSAVDTQAGGATSSSSSPGNKQKSRGSIKSLKETVKKPMGFFGRAKAALNTDKLQNRMGQHLMDRVELQMSSVKVEIQLGSNVVCGAWLESCSKASNEPKQGEMTHQGIKVSTLNIYVKPLDEPEVSMEDTSVARVDHLDATVIRTAGRRFQDVRGVAVNADVRSLNASLSVVQCDALFAGLRSIRAWNIDVSLPEAGPADKAVLEKLPDDLSREDAAVLAQEAEVPLTSESVFYLKLLPSHCAAGLGWAMGKPMVLLNAGEGFDVELTLGERQRSARCTVRTLTASGDEAGDGEKPPGERLLLIAPRQKGPDGQAVALDIQFLQELPNTPLILVLLSSAEVLMLDDWLPVVHILRSCASHSEEYSQAKGPQTQSPPAAGVRWDINVRQSRFSFPGFWYDPGLLALHIACDLVRYNTERDDPRIMSFQGCSTNFVEKQKDNALFNDVSIIVDKRTSKKGDTELDIKVPPVVVGVTLAQFKGLSTILAAASWMTGLYVPDTVESSQAPVQTQGNTLLKLDAGKFSLVLIDTEGVAANLAVDISAAATTMQVLPTDKRMKVAALQVELILAQGKETLLDNCDITVSFGATIVGEIKELCVKTSIDRLHLLKLLAQALKRCLQDAGIGTGEGQSSSSSRPFCAALNLGRLQIIIDDPGHKTAVSVKGKELCLQSYQAKPSAIGLDGCSTAHGEVSLEFEECKFEARLTGKSELRKASEDEAWLSVLRISGTSRQRAGITLGSTLSVKGCVSVLVGPQMAASSYGKATTSTDKNRAFRTEDTAEISGSVDGRTLAGGNVNVGSVVLNTTDNYIKEIATLIGHLSGEVNAILDTQSMVFHSDRTGLTLQDGNVVNKAEGFAKAGGIVPGSVIISVGNTQIKPDTDVKKMLKTSKPPTPVQFIRPPEEAADITVDLTIEPILVKVDYFRTDSGREMQDLQVHLGRVSLQKWTGSPGNLSQQLAKKYMVELAKGMPWFSESLKGATSIVKGSASKAVDALAWTSGRVGGVTNLAVSDTRDLTLKLTSPIVDTGKQIGNLAHGVLGWWGVVEAPPAAKAPRSSKPASPQKAPPGTRPQRHLSALAPTARGKSKLAPPDGPSPGTQPQRPRTASTSGSTRGKAKSKASPARDKSKVTAAKSMSAPILAPSVLEGSQRKSKKEKTWSASEAFQHEDEFDAVVAAPAKLKSKKVY